MRWKTHKLRTKHRVATLKVRETKSEIYLNLTMTEYGELDDLPEIQDWLYDILHVWEGDGRPVIMRHPLTGERATIFDGGVAFINQGAH